MSEAGLTPRARAILWTDGLAGATVGILVLVLRSFVAELDGFSLELVTFLGGANLAYGCYSTTLAVRAARGRAPSRAAVTFLIVANTTWVVVCARLAIGTWHDATWIGTAHLIIEGVFVGALAIAEWKHVRPLAIPRGT